MIAGAQPRLIDRYLQGGIKITITIKPAARQSREKTLDK